MSIEMSKFRFNVLIISVTNVYTRVFAILHQLTYKHLDGEVYRRCPMCFDTITRESLRGSVPHIVHTPSVPQTAKFVLLQRGKAELVPRCDSWMNDAVQHSSNVTTSNADGSAAYCPHEGDAAEVFSRLIIAQVSF
jgi:hypothetical protein